VSETSASERGRVSVEAPGTVPGRGGRGARLGFAVLLGVGFAVLVMLFVLASRHAFGGNSDDATLVLEGQSMSSGHLALQGWALSFDSFWTLDVPFYAVAVGLLGVGQDLFNVVPAFIAALVVVTGVWMIRMGRRDLASLIGASAAIALLALPGPDLAYFLLQAGWHVTTALCCLLAFVGISRSPSRWGLAIAAVLIAAGLLGDLLTLTLVVIPTLVAGAVCARRQGSWRAGRGHLAVVAGGIGLAVCVRLVAMAIGTYSIGSRSVLAAPSQLLTNIEAVPNRLGGLFGVTGIVDGLASSPAPLQVARAALLVLVIGAVAASVIDIARALGPRSRPPGSACEDWRVDDLLVIAVGCDVGSFVLFGTDSNVSLTRYLLPGFIFAAVLSGRALARLIRKRQSLNPRVLALAAVIVVALCAVDFALDSLGAAAPQEARQLSTFLMSRHLRAGIGDYWSSSVVSVDTGGSVVVRPVDLNPSGTLVRYEKQTTKAWYSGQSFQFFIYDTADNWFNVNGATAVKTFGKPSRIYSVGTYRVLEWPHTLRISS